MGARAGVTKDGRASAQGVQNSSRSVWLTTKRQHTLSRNGQNWGKKKDLF